MRLLIDTDAFCKLAICDLLAEGVATLGMQLADCARLPALPFMLRKGKLRARLGPDASDRIVPLASSLAAAPTPSALWLDQLTGVEAVDPGEAQLVAVAAEGAALLLTGDKRSLQAISAIPDFPPALIGRIVLVEAVLVAMCDSLGVEHVRARIQPALLHDVALAICFTTTNQDPRAGLLSYYRSAVASFAPLVLWRPPAERQD